MRPYMFRFIRFSCLCGLFIMIAGCRKVAFPQVSATLASPIMIATSTQPLSSPTPTLADTATPLLISSSTPTNSPLPSRTPSPPPPTSTPTKLSPSDPNQIRAMLIDQKGDLWTGGPGGVVHWNVVTGAYAVYTTEQGLASNDVVTIAQTNDGVLWFGTFGAGISSFDGTIWQTYTIQDGLPSNYIGSLAVTSDGTLWVYTSPYESLDKAGHLGWYDGHNWIPIIAGDADTVVIAPDKSFWGFNFWSLPLWHFNGQEEWFPLYHVTALAVDSNGVAWVGTSTSAYRIASRTIYKLDPPWQGTTGQWISSIAISPDGAVWFGFSYTLPVMKDKCGFVSEFDEEVGVYRYDEKYWKHITVEDGLVDNKICSIVAGLDGNVWFGSFDKGVSRFDGNIWTTYSVPYGSEKYP
jgi:ligand-binding sensor domain-containing protein